MQPHVLILADAGCSGNCKNSQKQQNTVQEKKAAALSGEEKAENRKLSKKRMKVEHIFRKYENMKIFRILRENCRNRRKRFRLRFNLIAACCNLAARSA